MNESTALAKSTYLPPPDRNEWASMIEMANTLAKAQGFLPQHFYGQPYKILAAVLFGRDLGISATNALQHIIVIDGKATADAQLIGMLVRRAGHSIEDETTAEASTVTITRGDDKTKHEVTFSMQDAQRAGLLRTGSAWSKYPQAMLYARALTACARKGAQDALMGTIYTAEELGVEVSANGDVALPPSAPTGEIPILEASPATVAALTEERERHERQQAEANDALFDPLPHPGPLYDSGDEIAPFNPTANIPQATTKLEASPRETGATTPATGSTEAQPAAKRRGRPLGSKNGGKGEQGAEQAGDRKPVAVGTTFTPAPSPAGFGDEPDELEPLRSEIRQLASRLRKYQYMEQHRDLPPIEQWNREVERTLGIFIERKFGTEVVLDDVEESGLREAISDLRGYIEKYESPEVDLEAQNQDLSDHEGGGTAKALESYTPDTTVVSLHKPIVRNPVAAQRRDDPTRIDPKVALDRARLVADLRNRTTALLATKEGLINLSAKDEERLRGQADKTMESAAVVSFGKAVKELDNAQLETLVARVKAATR